MAHDAWNPGQYLRFQSERSRPFFDLMGLVQPFPGMTIIDLGCGTGELTAEMHRAFQASQTTGVDRSDNMLERSAAFQQDGLRFVKADISSFEPTEPVDLILSNAALQWVPDNQGVLRRIASFLRPGGQIAVQVPANDDQPSHALAHLVAQEEPFRTALEGWVRSSFIELPEDYATLLFQLGAVEQHVRMQVYTHVLAATDEVIEWTRGSILTAYEQRLPPELFPLYINTYRERVLEALGAQTPYFYPFKRVLFWGRWP